jgi:hypothetical protein
VYTRVQVHARTHKFFCLHDRCMHPGAAKRMQATRKNRRDLFKAKQ